MSPRPLDQHRAQFLDIVESVGASADIGTAPLLGGSRNEIPTVKVTLDHQYATFQRPTFVACFRAAEDWLEAAVNRAEARTRRGA